LLIKLNKLLVSLENSLPLYYLLFVQQNLIMDSHEYVFLNNNLEKTQANSEIKVILKKVNHLFVFNK